MKFSAKIIKKVLERIELAFFSFYLKTHLKSKIAFLANLLPNVHLQISSIYFRYLIDTVTYIITDRQTNI